MSPGHGLIRSARPQLLSLVASLTIASCASSEPSAATTPQSSSTSTISLGSTPPTPALPTTTTLSATTTSAVDDNRVEIRVEGGAVVEGPEELEVDLGSDVLLVVVTDAADHIHVHGYDLFFDLNPDEEVEIEFVADVPGVFEVELEDTGLLLLELEVS